MLHGLHPSYSTEETEELTINNTRILFIYSCKYYESFSDPDQVVECVCIFISSSISSGDQYVILHTKIGWRKVKMCRFGSGKWFWLSISGQFMVARKKRCNAVPHAEREKRECNKYDLTAAQCFWLAHHKMLFQVACY